MNKTILASALLLVAGIGSAQAAQVNAQANGFALEASASTINNNFTMNGPAGGITGGTNDVAMTWDGTVFNANSDYTGPGGVSNMTLSTTTLFNSFPWVAHDVQVFAPGTYTFDTTVGGGNTEAGIQTLTIGSGQLGAHMLFDWGGAAATSCGKANCNIDVSILWNANAAYAGNFYAGPTNPAGNSATTIWNAVSVDGDNNGIMGISMAAGGPFGGFSGNFNLQGITPSAVPVPAAVWLLGSGLLGLVGVARRKMAA